MLSISQNKHSYIFYGMNNNNTYFDINSNFIVPNDLRAGFV